jgi:hypothetical protein
MASSVAGRSMRRSLRLSCVPAPNWTTATHWHNGDFVAFWVSARTEISYHHTHSEFLDKDGATAGLKKNIRRIE